MDEVKKPTEPYRYVIFDDDTQTKGYEYLKHLIRKENENAQRANGCTY